MKVTRMQDLASFSKKIFGGDTWTLTARGGDPLLHPTPSSAFGRARGASVPVLGPKPWSRSTFQPWLRPWQRRKNLEKWAHYQYAWVFTFYWEKIIRFWPPGFLCSSHIVVAITLCYSWRFASAPATLPLLDHAASLPVPQNCGTLYRPHFGIQHSQWHHSVAG